MRDQIRKVYNYISRVISNDELAYKVYMIWGVLTLTFFGFLGIYRISSVVISNIKLTSSMSRTNLQLNKKIQDLKEVERKISILAGEDALLDRYLPNDFESHNFLVDLVFLTNNTNYSVERFLPSLGYEGSNYVDVSIHLIGTGNIHELIKNIEESKYLLEVQNIKISRSIEEESIILSVRFFIMENNEKVY